VSETAIGAYARAVLGLWTLRERRFEVFVGASSRIMLSLAAFVFAMTFSAIYGHYSFSAGALAVMLFQAGSYFALFLCAVSFRKAIYKSGKPLEAFFEVWVWLQIPFHFIFIILFTIFNFTGKYVEQILNLIIGAVFLFYFLFMGARAVKYISGSGWPVASVIWVVPYIAHYYSFHFFLSLY